MSAALFVACVWAGIQSPGGEVVVSDLAARPFGGAFSCPTDGRVEHTADFTVGKSPYVLGETYLWAQSQPAGESPGRIRVPAPEGSYYVYLAWVRHPRGAKDVVVRVGGVEVTVDQGRLAGGLSPDARPRDDMGQWAGLCSSGLFRVTDRPIQLRRGDALEITRSDTQPDSAAGGQAEALRPW